MRQQIIFIAALTAAVGLAGCASNAPTLETAAQSPPPAAEPQVAAQISRVWPIDTELYRTTSGETYLHNLDGRIAGLEERHAQSHSTRDVEKLASALYHRYRLLGRLADGERALALMTAVDPEQFSGDGQLLLGIVLTGFHRFEEAAAAYDRAEKMGVNPDDLQQQRNDLWVALGDYQRLKDDFSRSNEPVANLYELAHRADLRVLKGDLAGAERQYWAAQTQYNDVSPVPLAWLHTQMGIAKLRFGQFAEAKPFFEAAVARLPGYYLAEEHLAECEAQLGMLDAARERYRRVIEQTDGNPEFTAALAGVERDAGNNELADRLTRQAKDGYRDLLEKHLAGYAQHASEFYIETGEPQEALRLATLNAELRGDIGSVVLLASAQDANGERAKACASARRAHAFGLMPPELIELDAQLGSCGR